MKTRLAAAVAVACAINAFAAAPPPVAKDPLGRENPRSAVTRFLETCHQHDYGKAAQFLDLSKIPAKIRANEGPERARDLESVLNSDSHFDALHLSPQPNGNLADDPDPNIEHVAEVSVNDEKTLLELQRITPASGPAIWLFSPATVAALPKLVPMPSAESAIEARLPRVLVTTQLLDTALWKWLGLILLAAILALVVRLFLRTEGRAVGRVKSFGWAQAIVRPVIVIIAVAGFRVVEEMVNPSALSRLYIGRVLLMAVVLTVAWSVMNLFDLFLLRLDTLVDPRQRQVAHSLIYLARRVGNVLIMGFAVIIVLDNWEIHMTTIIAGIGVGGIAVALAAQQTIANIFGGVSVLSDNPVMIGDFGSFGGVVGTVEEIGLRSARIRTLNRTLVSIPNSSFATINLENYAERDKILFNPTIQVKRPVAKEKVRELMKRLADVLAANPHVEAGSAPVRISAYSAASFAVEIFAYVLTPDINEFYKYEADLFLAIDDAVIATGVELA